MIQITLGCLTFCFLGVSTYLNLKAGRNENIPELALCLL